MDSIFFYMYLTAILLSTLAFTILRCVFKLHEYDFLFYPNHNNNIMESKFYLISHIIINYIIVYLFGFNVLVGMLVKIAIFEIYLYMIEKCDVFKTTKFDNLVIIIILSAISYTLGSLTKLAIDNYSK